MPKSYKSTYIIAAVSLVIIFVAVYFLFIFQKSPKEIKPEDEGAYVEDISKIEIAKRPYVTLTPTSDGAEILISIENMDFFYKIKYELTYQADNPQVTGEKLERGSTGIDVNTKEQKYKKSILLGTASKGTRSPDKGIADGKLTLHLFKDDTEYQSETNWDLFNEGAKAAEIGDRSNQFAISLPSLGKDYYIIIADTVGVPRNGEFDANKATLPIYGIFSVAPDLKSSAKITLKVNSDLGSAQLYSFNSKDEKWQKLVNRLQDSEISASASSLATFVVVSP